MANPPRSPRPGKAAARVAETGPVAEVPAASLPTPRVSTAQAVAEAPLPIPGMPAASLPVPVAPALPPLPHAVPAPEAGLAAAPVAQPVPSTPVPTAPKPAPQPDPAPEPAQASFMETKMDQITRSTEGFYKASEDAVEFGRGNLEAFAKASQTYFSGLQDLGKQAFAVWQSLGEQGVQNARALASVKSIKEAAELQSGFAKSALETSVAEATKLNEAAFKLAEQASAPIAARVTLAMEKFGRPASFN